MKPELEAKTQTEAAELFDISQPAVSKALKNITKTEDSSKKVIIPPHITERHAIADFRKLSPEGQGRLRKRKVVTLPFHEGAAIGNTPKRTRGRTLYYHLLNLRRGASGSNGTFCPTTLRIHQETII